MTEKMLQTQFNVYTFPIKRGSPMQKYRLIEFGKSVQEKNFDN